MRKLLYFATIGMLAFSIGGCGGDGGGNTASPTPSPTLSPGAASPSPAAGSPGTPGAAARTTPRARASPPRARAGPPPHPRPRAQPPPTTSPIPLPRGSGPAPRLDQIHKPRRTSKTSSSRHRREKDSTGLKRDSNSTDPHPRPSKRSILNPSPSTAQNRRRDTGQRTPQAASPTSAKSAQAARRDQPPSVDARTALWRTGGRRNCRTSRNPKPRTGVESSQSAVNPHTPMEVARLPRPSSISRVYTWTAPPT